MGILDALQTTFLPRQSRYIIPLRDPGNNTDMAYGRYWSCHPRRRHLPSMHHLRPRTDSQPRNTQIAHLEEEAVGVEHWLDGTGAVSSNCLHGHPRHEATIWKAAS